MSSTWFQSISEFKKKINDRLIDGIFNGSNKKGENMANCCFIEMELTFETSKRAKEFYKEVSKILEDANKQLEGANIFKYIGDTTKYVFDGKITIDDNKCKLYGWVKWYYDEVQFYSFCIHIDELKSANVFQYEPMSNIFGRYVYKAKYNVPYKKCFHEYFIPEKEVENMNMDEDELIEYCRKETMKMLKNFLE